MCVCALHPKGPRVTTRVRCHSTETYANTLLYTKGNNAAASQLMARANDMSFAHSGAAAAHGQSKCT